MILASNPVTVGVLDMVSIALLIHIGTWRGLALAAIFASLVPVYILGERFEWPPSATYAIVDVLGYSIILVLASGNGGNRNKRRADAAGSAGGSVSAPQGHVATERGGENIQVPR